MKTIRIQKGDSLRRIAEQENIPVERIWNDEGNAKLREKRKSPDHLCKDDPVVIPDPEPKTKDDRTRQANESSPPAKIVVQKPTMQVRLRLLVDGEPCSGATCETATTTTAVTTGKDGSLVLDVPAGQVEFQLKLQLPEHRSRGGKHVIQPARGRTITLSVAHLDDELARFKANLTNLGFHCDPVDGSTDLGRFPVRTKCAFLRFRKAFGLDVGDEHHVRREHPVRKKFLDRKDLKYPQYLDTLEEIRLQEPDTLTKLERLHLQQESWAHRFSDEDKLCRTFRPEGSQGVPEDPIYYVIPGPQWNRVNLLEGAEVIIDAHMHINSGKCSPMPLVWDKKSYLKPLRPSREEMNKGLPTLSGLGGAEDAAFLVKRLQSRVATEVMKAHATVDEAVMSLLALSVSKALIAAGYVGKELKDAELAIIDHAATLIDYLATSDELAAQHKAEASSALSRAEQWLRDVVPDQPARATELVREANGLTEQILFPILRAYYRQRDAAVELSRIVANEATERAADVPAAGAAAAGASAWLDKELARIHRAVAGALHAHARDSRREVDLAYQDARDLIDYVANAIRTRNRTVHEDFRAGAETGSTVKSLLGLAAVATFGKIGKMNTVDIANEAVKGTCTAYKDLPPQTGGGRLNILIALPMDMDFGHARGYDGEQIYKPWSKRKELRLTLEEREIQPDGPRPPFSRKLTFRVLPPDTPLKTGRARPPTHATRDYWVPDGPGRAKGYTIEFTTTEDVVEVPGTRYSYNEWKSDAGWFQEETKGQLVKTSRWLGDDEFDAYQGYPRQVEDTLDAAAASPWKILPLYHYDPRRWNAPGGGPKPAPPAVTKIGDKTFETFPQPWDMPFRTFFKENGPRPFIGFKLYSALGYRPADWRLPYQDAFYAGCGDTIPIVCHCTPGGQYTMERELYVMFEREACARAGRRFSLDDERRETLDLMRRRGVMLSPENSEKWPEHWFSEHYIAPVAWREVLKNHPKLRLSLAHFGGDEEPYSHWCKPDPPDPRPDLLELKWEPSSNLLWDDQIIKLTKEYDNFYVDLSYFIFNDLRRDRLRKMLEIYPHLREKILFGTDWWMTELDRADYAAMANRTRLALDQINPELWERFTWINPVRFYRLTDIAEDIARALRSPRPGLKNQDPAATRARMQAIEYGLKLIRTLDPGSTQ